MLKINMPCHFPPTGFLFLEQVRHITCISVHLGLNSQCMLQLLAVCRVSGGQVQKNCRKTTAWRIIFIPPECSIFKL